MSQKYYPNRKCSDCGENSVWGVDNRKTGEIDFFCKNNECQSNHIE